MAVLVAAAAALRWPSTASRGLVDVTVPASLSAQARSGQRAFDANCARCHGENGGGTDQGPPLVHDIYNPGHHADAAFYLAAQRGVFAHHWSFGDMPPQPNVTRKELDGIVRYVRELQQANGITWKPHRM
ncbi:MAG: cytochrome c [Gammaproteobacteria bacterium]|nr:cytochrome c [Gammaproteobacteria bacterium]NIR84342.1 cytochrome c [Gammaproteobacteria bacterium]NIR89858.1 cytochrome c [Gammaproteobacteria bacterium]NIU05725.1 cytochrome c [Gammaproteobacteria bacterium]NIV52485.1 c-type cytochrome [Gammaproteobacteria bacterium]